MPLPPTPQFANWMNAKLAMEAKDIEGRYRLNVAQAGEVAPSAAAQRALWGAEAYKYGEEGKQVAPTSAAERERLSAEAFRARAGGQLESEQAITEGQNRLLGPLGAEEYLRQQNEIRTKLGLPQLYPAQPGQGLPSSRQPDPLLDTSPGKALPQITPGIRGGSVPNPYYRPPQTSPNQPASPPQTGSSISNPLDPNQSVLPLNKPFVPDRFQTGTADVMPLRRGTASVKGSKGGGGSSKAGTKGGSGGGGGGSAAPQGLEQILPALLAASQASQMGGGAIGPQAADGSPPPMVPGAAAPPGMARGKANVKPSGKGKGKAGGPPKGLEAILPALLAAAQSQQGGAQPGGPPPMAPSPAPPSGPPGMAVGKADVRNGHSAPGYPFGAGYLFGKTAVPGQGSGTTDTVPAMLAPHEAVLNRAAADMLGRGLIQALNARGVRAMGMGQAS